MDKTVNTKFPNGCNVKVNLQILEECDVTLGAALALCDVIDVIVYQCCSTVEMDVIWFVKAICVSW